MDSIDPNQFRHFVEIPCDRCGTVSSYSPDVVNDVTECFGCKCDRLHKMEIECQCGWKGNYFDQSAQDLTKRFCPNCGREGYNE